uniref:Small ribosomal subunit protein mS33 n=1 Tax=Rhizochromulina marina TaxID=1034831 RepID=A0A7S2WK26_9STRA
MAAWLRVAALGRPGPAGFARCTLATLSDGEVRELREAGRRIFGNLPLSPDRTGNKVLRKKWLGPIVTSGDHKPFHDVIRRAFPTLGTEEQDHRRQKLSYLRRRGKGPPMKGAGKRSAKKK